MAIIKRELIITKTPPQKTTYTVGFNLLDDLSSLEALKNSNADKFLLLTDENLFALYGKRAVESIKKTGREVTTAVVASGEKSKTLQSVESACRTFLEGKASRSSILVTLGGGVITDLGGFIGSILLRGIRVIHLPTTLLAQIDAGIGGKSGVDFWTREGMLKNMIGKTEQPYAVISDVSLLSTLPKIEVINGLGEMVKYWIGWRKPSIEQLIAAKTLQMEELANIISLCQQIKINTIRKDPFDILKIREKLNLGHTIGHAIEAEQKGKLSHGESVALGLIAATKISVKTGILSSVKAARIIETVKALGLPVMLKEADKKTVMDLTAFDKKNGTFVLIKDIGKLQTRCLVDRKIILDAISEVII